MLTPEQVRNVLHGALAYVGNPGTWTRLMPVQDMDGWGIDDLTDPHACAFCAFGALQRAAYDSGIANYEAAAEYVISTTLGMRVSRLIWINDSWFWWNGRGKVLRILEEALAAA